MKLKENEVYSISDMAAFLGISPKSFSAHRQRYLEELKNYIDYSLIMNSSGRRIKGIKVLTIYCDEVNYKLYKSDFINWLSNNDVFELTAEDGYSNLTIITNYYCNLKGIPYNGPHYIEVEDIGMSFDNKRIVKQTKKVPNPEFKIWHYLYQLSRRYFSGKNESRIKDYVDMCSGEFRPIYIKKMTEAEKQKYNKIAYEVYGNQAANFAETTEAVEDMNVSNMSAEEMRKEILNLRSIRDMTDKDKRRIFYARLAEAGLLKYKGYKRKDS